MAKKLRKPEWATQLRLVVEEYEEVPFEWGLHDCCLFAADCVYAMSGIDFAAPFRGEYNSRSSALAAISQIGGGSLEMYLDDSIGAENRIDPMFAFRGDVILTHFDGMEMLGVSEGRNALFKGIKGVVAIPLGQCKTAWRIR